MAVCGSYNRAMSKHNSNLMNFDPKPLPSMESPAPGLRAEEKLFIFPVQGRVCKEIPSPHSHEFL